MRSVYRESILTPTGICKGRSNRPVRFRKMTIAVMAISIVFAFILLGSGLKAFAGSNRAELPVYKYYTNIEVQPGDTLWSIAQEYTQGTDISLQDYVEEICTLNHISADHIHEGGHLVISYYSTEEK